MNFMFYSSLFLFLLVKVFFLSIVDVFDKIEIWKCLNYFLLIFVTNISFYVRRRRRRRKWYKIDKQKKKRRVLINDIRGELWVKVDRHKQIEILFNLVLLGEQRNTEARLDRLIVYLDRYSDQAIWYEFFDFL